MKPIPHNMLAGFNDLLKRRNVPPLLLADYRKWLLYFLDFSAKYPLPDSPSDQVRLFADKLRSKNQTAGQIEQAADAISLFFASRSVSKIKTSLVTGGAPGATQQFESEGSTDRNPVSANTAQPMVCEPPGGPQFAPPERSGRRYDEWRCLRKTEAPAWDAIIEKLAAEIQVRHYSRKTLKHYADWGRKFHVHYATSRPISCTNLK